MFSFISFDYLSSLLLFLLGVFLAFYIPGNIFVRRLKLERTISNTISFILGIALWGLQGFILGMINLRELTYVYLAIFGIYWLYVNLNYFKKFKFPRLEKPDNKTLLIILILIAGTALQLFSIIWNYFPSNGGLIFISGVPDNFYHAAVLKELIKNVPPMEPGVSGAAIFNYHFLSNLIGADFARVFKVNYLFLDFHYFVVFLTILFGLSFYSFGKTLNIGKNYIIFLLIIIYFVGDLLPYLTLITRGTLDFSNSTLENPLSLWVSFSRYIGIILYLGGLTMLTYFIKTKNKTSAVIFALIFGSIIGFKVYIGILALIGLVFLGLYYIYKKNYFFFTPLVIAITASLILYLPINKNAGGLVFTGFWRFEDFIANSNWGLSRLELARRVYEDSNNYIKIIMYESFYVFVYVLFSVGFLLTGFLNSKTSLRKLPKELHIFLISGLVIASILAFFFIQSSGGANSFQFTISIYIIGSIYAALALNRFSQSSNKILYSIVIIMLVFSFIRVTGTTHANLVKLIEGTHVYTVKEEYLDAVDKLGTLPDSSGIVLTDLYFKDDCIFVSLISDKSIFFCEAAAPGDKGLINVKMKKASINKMLYGKESEARKEFELNNIEYMIATKGAIPKFLKKAYSNEKYQILILKK